MNVFNVSDYSDFVVGSKTILFAQGCLYQTLEAIIGELGNLDSDDVFSGPICDSVMSGWNDVVGPYKNSIQELIKFSSGLSTIKNNYETSDNTNANNIGGV